MLELLQVLHDAARLGVLSIDLQAELAGLSKHAAATRKLGHEHPLLVADERRVDVLVRVRLLQDRGHVLAALVRKRALADERLLSG